MLSDAHQLTVPEDRGTGAEEPRWRARRGRGGVWLGLAVFFAVLAVLLPGFTYPRLALLPIDPDQTTGQTAEDADVLLPDSRAPGFVRKLQDVDLKVTTHTTASRGAESEPVGNSVVWDIATRVEVVGVGLLNARVETVSLDRRTAYPTNCCGDRLVTSTFLAEGTPLVHRGYVNFPFNTRRTTYPVWDATLNRARLAEFVETTRWQGIRTYRFRARQPLTTLNAATPLPGAVFGASGLVTPVMEYTDTREYWVEPATGVPIHIRDRIQQRYRYNGTVVTALDATLESDPKTAAQVTKYRRAALALNWLRWKASVLLLLVAAALVVVHVRGRRMLREGGPPPA